MAMVNETVTTEPNQQQQQQNENQRRPASQDMLIDTLKLCDFETLDDETREDPLKTQGSHQRREERDLTVLQQHILADLRSEGVPRTISQVTESVGDSYEAVKLVLWRMEREGLAVKTARGGKVSQFQSFKVSPPREEHDPRADDWSSADNDAWRDQYFPSRDHQDGEEDQHDDRTEKKEDES